MNLESYVNVDESVIRIQGTRMAIDVVLERYKEGASAEMIVEEQIYGVITYYLCHQDEVEAYLQKNTDKAQSRYQEYVRQEPSEIKKRLMAIRDDPKELARLKLIRRQNSRSRRSSA